MPADLTELLCRLQRGDEGAEDRLAEAARTELTRIARARVRDAAAIDDVVQEALLEVLATHDRLREPAAARAWLRLIVRKHADRMVRKVRSTGPLGEFDLADPSDGPDRLAERRGDVATIRRALSVVRDADALLLRLRYLGEWTDAELANLVGATPGTVRKRIHDARRRLRAAVETRPARSNPPRPEVTVTEFEQLLGRAVAPDDVPVYDPVGATPSGRRLETGIKVLDAVLPVELGGTVDLLGPAGLGQLVLVAEIAVHLDAVIVAAGSDPTFSGLFDDDLDVAAIVVEGDTLDAARAAQRAADALAASGRTVLVVLDPATWSAAPPSPGTVSGAGSITAFRFAPHPRDGDATPPLPGATTTLVYATDHFINGMHPAIDVLASRSALVDDHVLDPVTVGAARAARQTLARARQVRDFLAQAMVVGEPYTGVPGEQVPARDATEALAALVR